LCLGKANLCERRIDVKGAHRDTVAYTAGGFLQEIVGYYLKIVIRSVSKRSSSVAISKRPNPWDRGLELIVYSYKSVLIGIDAGRC
jgi:hypothetical protein